MKRLFLVIAAAIALVGCGDKNDGIRRTGTYMNLSWNLAHDGTMTVMGQGAMPDYMFLPERYPTSWDYDHNEIKKVIINEGVTHVGDYAFDFCFNLTEVRLPGSVTTIGSRAFSHTSIKHCTIPANVFRIGSGAFSYCRELEQIVLPERVHVLESTFEGCTKLSNVVLPAQVWQLNGGVFSGCTALRSVTIPQDIVVIDDNAFAGCENLTSITCLASLPPAISGGGMKHTSVYVPAESLELYRSHSGWSGKFKEINPIQE